MDPPNERFTASATLHDISTPTICRRLFVLGYEDPPQNLYYTARRQPRHSHVLAILTARRILLNAERNPTSAWRPRYQQLHRVWHCGAPNRPASETRCPPRTRQLSIRIRCPTVICLGLQAPPPFFSPPFYLCSFLIGLVPFVRTPLNGYRVVTNPSHSYFYFCSRLPFLSQIDLNHHARIHWSRCPRCPLGNRPNPRHPHP